MSAFDLAFSISVLMEHVPQKSEVAMKRTSLIAIGMVTLAAILGGCDTPRPTEPPVVGASLQDDRSDALANEVRQLAAGRGIGPLSARPRVRPPLVRLGQALAFDRILSGNHDISCMTCHPPAFATGDGKSLSVGQGGTGLGPGRSHPQGVFIPRDAPSFFNLNELQRLFWDGRVAVDESGRFHTPAGDQVTPAMEQVFEFGAISALALFPVTNREEMRASNGNELADIPDDDFTGIWNALMQRLGNIREYRDMFEEAYPGTRFEQMTFAHASNAIGAFIVEEFSFDNSPSDRFV